MTAIVLDMFTEEKVLDVLKQGVRAKRFLVSLASSIMTDCCNLRTLAEKDHVFQHIWSSDCSLPLKTLADRLENLSRCWLHCFCIAPPKAYDGKATRDADVMFFYQYNGSDMLERCIRRMMNDEKCWWRGEVSEMIKKGAGGVLNQDKLDELTAALQAPSANLSCLGTCMNLLKQVRESTRSQRLAAVMDEFADSCLYIGFLLRGKMGKIIKMQ